jgi:hypothetical protein
MSSHPETFELQYFMVNNTEAGNILKDATLSQKHEPGGTAGMSRRVLARSSNWILTMTWPAIMATNLI